MTNDQIADEYVRQIASDGYDTSDEACVRKEMRELVENASRILARHGLSVPETYEDCKRLLAPIAMASMEPQGYGLFQDIIKLELTMVGSKSAFDESDFCAAMDEFVKAAFPFFASRGLSVPDTYQDCKKSILDILESEGYHPAMDEILKVELRGIKLGGSH